MTDHDFVRQPHKSVWAGCAVCGHMHNEVDPAPLSDSDALDRIADLAPDDLGGAEDVLDIILTIVGETGRDIS